VATNWTECSDRPCSHLYSPTLQCHSLQAFVIIYLLWNLVSVNYVYTVEQSELGLQIVQSKLCRHHRTELIKSIQ